MDWRVARTPIIRAAEKLREVFQVVDRPAAKRSLYATNVEQSTNSRVAEITKSGLAPSPSGTDALIDEAIGLATDLHCRPPQDWPAQRIWTAILCDKIKTSALLGEFNQVIELSEITIEHIEQLRAHDRSYYLN